MRIRPWSLAFLMVAFCGCIVLALEWKRRSHDFSDAALLARFPGQEGVRLYVNVLALRESGLLEAIVGTRADEDAEYQAFVRTTGFDYRDDLDAAILHFGPDSQLFILRGRLPWHQISRFMKSYQEEVRCSNGVCSISLGRGRYLSAMPLAQNIVAVGLGTNRTVVYEALLRRQDTSYRLPEAPFWVEFSEDFLRQPKRLPEGTRAFLGAVKDARHVFLSVVPGRDSLEARLFASFRSPAEAATHRASLEEKTALLKTMIERQRQRPEQSDIASMLLAGTFEQKESEVLGRWPMPSSLFREIFATK